MRRAILVRFVTLSGLALGLSVAPCPDLWHAQGYEGVVPGPDSVPGTVASAAGARTSGHLAGLPGAGRRRLRAIFVQTSGPVQPELKREGTNWVGDHPRCAASQGQRPSAAGHALTSTRRSPAPVCTPLATRGKRRKQAQAGAGVSLLLEMRADVTPRLHTEKAPNGYFFTYIEFAAGKYN